MRRMTRRSYTVASQTWILGLWFLPAVTLTLIVTYQHHDDPTAPPTSELQRVIELGQAGRSIRHPRPARSTASARCMDKQSPLRSLTLLCRRDYRERAEIAGSLFP